MNNEQGHGRKHGIHWKNVLTTSLIAALMTVLAGWLMKMLAHDEQHPPGHEKHAKHQFYATKGYLEESKDTSKVLSTIFNTGQFVEYRDKSGRKSNVLIQKDVIARGKDASFYHLIKNVHFGTEIGLKRKFWQGGTDYDLILSEELEHVLGCTTTGRHYCIPTTFAALSTIVVPNGTVESNSLQYYPVVIFSHATEKDVAYVGFIELTNENKNSFISRLNSGGCQQINVPDNISTMPKFIYQGREYMKIVYDPNNAAFWL